jgi:transposase
VRLEGAGTDKTDRNDACGIAQMMRMGWYRAVHVKGVETQRMRTLLANRRLLKRKLIDLENHIRGALRAFGLRVGQVSRGNFDDRVRELIEHADYVFEVMITTLLEVRRTVLEGYNKLHKIVLQVVIHDPLCRRFMAVPGVGPIAALTFKVAVEDPRRFARSRTVGAYFGLTPRRHQSGTSIDFTGHISKMGDLNARGALCEAAASLLLRSRRRSALKAWGMRIAKRQSMMCAIVAVARKLAAILHRLWIDGSEFQWTTGAKVTEKIKLKPAKA